MSAVKILVTTDGSNLSDKAVDTAIELAEQVGGSRTRLLKSRCLAKLWSSTPRRCLRECLLAQPESMPPIS